MRKKQLWIASVVVVMAIFVHGAYVRNTVHVTNMAMNVNGKL
jgi:hypothetical protein